MKDKTFHLERQMIGDYFYVYVTGDVGGKRLLAIEPEFKEIDDTSAYNEPTFRITPDDAQGLIDELWRAGLRPTEGTGSAGSFAAQGKHLEDMRKLVFETKV